MRLSFALSAWMPSLRNSRFLQIALLILLWEIGQEMATYLHVPLPGGIIGLLLTLALLGSGQMNADHLRRGAQWFLGEMMLFFIPAIPAIGDHAEFLGWTGFKIALVIVGSSLSVMIVTALTVDFCYRRMGSSAQRKPAS